MKKAIKDKNKDNVFTISKIVWETYIMGDIMINDGIFTLKRVNNFKKLEKAMYIDKENNQITFRYPVVYEGGGIRLNMAFESKEEILEEIKVKLEILSKQKKLIGVGNNE